MRGQRMVWENTENILRVWRTGGDRTESKTLTRGEDGGKPMEHGSHWMKVEVEQADIGGRVAAWYSMHTHGVETLAAGLGVASQAGSYIDMLIDHDQVS